MNPLAILLAIIDRLTVLALRLIPAPPDSLVLDLKVTDAFSNPPNGEPQMLRLPDDKQVQLSINPLSRRGNPARIDGTPRWTSSDESVVTLTPSEDGKSATAKAVGPTGTAQISVVADADLGEGVREITGIETIEVVEGEAATVGITAGEITDQP